MIYTIFHHLQFQKRKKKEKKDKQYLQKRFHLINRSTEEQSSFILLNPPYAFLIIAVKPTFTSPIPTFIEIPSIIRASAAMSPPILISIIPKHRILLVNI